MSEQTLQKKRSLGWYLLLAIVIVSVTAFVVVALWRTFVPNADVWTNDAKIDAHYTTIAPRVEGQVSQVLVDDNAQVHAGQPLVRLDSDDYQTAVAVAKAKRAGAQAELAEITAEIARQPARIAKARATLKKDQAEAGFARRDVQRSDQLARRHAISREEQQRRQATADSAKAQVSVDQADLQDAKKQRAVLKTRKQQAEAKLQQVEQDLKQARLNLSYTTIRAPEDGVVGELAARIGTWVDPGNALMAIVPLQHIFVTAHYRETQLTHVAPGQRVSIDVDAFPNLHLKGHVASLAPATGVTFSPVATDNATGNFTKVTQRLPVKITIDPAQGATARLKQGMSVETTIHTRLRDVHSNLGTGQPAHGEDRLHARSSTPDHDF